MAILDVQDLQVRFPVESTWGRRPRAWIKAVDGVSFSLTEGETLGLVGESGCGKTTLGRAVVRLQEPTSGKIIFNGVDLAHMRGAGLRGLRRQFQMVFQNPQGSLNPRLTIGQILAEPLQIHCLASGRAVRRAKIRQLLEDVGMDPESADRYPHQFSGGQRQRIVLARALAVDPRLVVCDEPVSALDVSVQAQIINLLSELQQQRRLSYLFISHDLAVVEHLSHRIMVMYLGRAVELAAAKVVCRSARHPYTQALLSAVPVLDPATRRQRILLSGEMPSPIYPPSGCPFHPRCPVAQSQCRQETPRLREVAPGHWVSCHLA
jgi:oligopeptide/dipeptide ABC transporter ATP-binding protein